MPRKLVRDPWQLLRFVFCLGFASTWLTAPSARALDLVPAIFKKQVINSDVWREQEQYVALAPQDEGATTPNQHPVTLEYADVRDALRALQLWQGAGILRDEESGPLLTKTQAELLARYVVEAAARARANEDVIFAVRGYAAIALDTLKEREWTSGRIFHADGKLNLIIGAYQNRKDRGKRNAEAAYGVLNDYSDMKFDTGERKHGTGKMSGRIVNSPGVTLAGGPDSGRTDWIQIEVLKAANAYRDGQVPEEEKSRVKTAQLEAARLTLERREMREEMARLRQELKAMKAGGGVRQTPEERLKTLLDLKSQKLITEDEYEKRRARILGDL
jgi:hypothetical protein